MAKKSYIKVVENDNKTVTFSFEMHIWYVVTKLDVNYFENNKEIRKEIEIFSFEIVDVSADYIVIRTNNPMSIIDNNRINLLSKETEFKVMRNEKLLLSTLTTDRSYKYEISIVDEPGKVIEKDKEKLSYGIYVDTNDIVYKVETTNQYECYNSLQDGIPNIYGFEAGSETILSKGSKPVDSIYRSLSELLLARGYIELNDLTNYPDFTYENVVYSYRAFKYDKLTLAYCYPKDSQNQTLFNYEFFLEGKLDN